MPARAARHKLLDDAGVLSLNFIEPLAQQNPAMWRQACAATACTHVEQQQHISTSPLHRSGGLAAARIIHEHMLCISVALEVNLELIVCFLHALPTRSILDLVLEVCTWVVRFHAT